MWLYMDYMEAHLPGIPLKEEEITRKTISYELQLAQVIRYREKRCVSICELHVQFQMYKSITDEFQIVQKKFKRWKFCKSISSTPHISVFMKAQLDARLKKKYYISLDLIENLQDTRPKG